MTAAEADLFEAKMEMKDAHKMQKNKVMLQEMDTGLAREEALLGQIDILIKHYIFWDVWVILLFRLFKITVQHLLSTVCVPSRVVYKMWLLNKLTLNKPLVYRAQEGVVRGPRAGCRRDAGDGRSTARPPASRPCAEPLPTLASL